MTNGATNGRWAWPADLHRSGVVGMNARNLHYLARLNPRAHYPRLDDKVLTKQLCEANGIAVPDTYAVVERFGEIRQLDRLLGSRTEFVVKPARGAGGRGVLVVVGRDAETFELARGTRLSSAELRYHLSTILSGLYSLGGRADRAIIEQRIRPHDVFRTVSVDGTPDVRVLVYRFTPAMAMLRLPTRASGGRANLHQGAVGVGVDMETGRTRGGVWHSRAVGAHPDTGASVAGHQIPHWDAILGHAARLGRALEMGYVGVDVVLDAERGPVVLEANTRPGLAIQIANRRGLRDVLDRIDRGL